MAESPVVQLRIPAGTLDRIDDVRGEEVTRSGWILAAVDSVLAGDQPAAVTPGARSLGPAIPAPGVSCMWAGCWNRDSDRYGVTDPAELTRGGYRERPRDENKCGIVLCKSHAATLEGRAYTRPRSPLRADVRGDEREPEPVV